VRLIVAILAFSAVIAAGLIDPAIAKRQDFSFGFSGLLAELRSADAIVRVRVNAWMPDSSLGWDPESKTWYRETIHVTVTRAFGEDSLRAGDTLAVDAWYSRLNREFYELEEKTQQFVFYSVPSNGAEAILLLKRTKAGWEATRSLYPDDAFVGTYVRTAGLPEQAAGPALIRLLLDEFLDVDRDMISSQIWGHIRVVEDDLDRMDLYGPQAEPLWRTEVKARADDIIRVAGSVDVQLFVELARYLPEPSRRECVRRLVRAYDSAVEELRRLGHVDLNPPEMTFELHRYLDASGAVTVLPEAMQALTPPDQTSHGESDARIIARARRYAFP
jgi:hypothetical protein